MMAICSEKYTARWLHLLPVIYDNVRYCVFFYKTCSTVGYVYTTITAKHMSDTLNNDVMTRMLPTTGFLPL